jgi:subtilase family serine protease
MGRTIRTLAAACLLALALAATAGAAQRRVAVGNAAPIPDGTSVGHIVSPQHRLRITLSLTSRDPIAMHTQALAVATPGSRQYGRTLTVAQFARRYGASTATLDRVRAALRRDGLRVVRTYANHLGITAAGPVSAVERTFATRLSHVRLANGRRALVNTAAPTLPAAIAGDVDAVFGLDSLADPRPAGARRLSRRGPSAAAVRRARRPASRTPDIATGGVQPCATATATAAPGGNNGPYFGYTADGLASAYGLPSLYSSGDFGQGQTILLYEIQSLDPNDVAAFQQCYGTAAPVSIVPVDSPDPVDYGGNGDGEAALDVDQIIGMAPQASIVVYEASQNDPDSNGELLQAIASQDRGKIVSISYGGCEADLGKSIAQAEGKLFDEMALQGQSVFASTGDTGVQGCQRVDGSQTVSIQDPASQPTVTGVGGTSLYSGTSQSPSQWNGSNALTEGIWNSSQVVNGAVDQAASSGGVSSLWAMPSYQQSAAALGTVNGYSGTGGCGAALCRELPDVSAEGDPDTGTVIYANTNDNGGSPGSQWQVYGGTSASAPLWAAFAALTDVLPSCRGLSVGDINPSLYALAGGSYATYFRDITAPGAFTSATTNWTDLSAAPTGIYPVAAGYDLITGLGSPLMNNLAPALCQTRAPVYTVTIGSPGTKRLVIHRRARFQVPASDSGAAPLSFNAVNLPPGMTIGASTGVISGTPTKLGRYAVTVGGEDFATNQSTGTFEIDVVRPPVPRSHFARTSLHGIAARQAKLRFIVSAPSHRRLRSVTIHLRTRTHLSFKRSNRGIFVHTDTGRRHRRVAHRARRHPGSLTIRFRRAQRKVIVVIGRRTLRVGPRLARRAHRHSFRLIVGLSATDTRRHTTRHTARVHVAKATPRHRTHRRRRHR